MLEPGSVLKLTHWVLSVREVVGDQKSLYQNKLCENINMMVFKIAGWKQWNLKNNNNRIS